MSRYDSTCGYRPAHNVKNIANRSSTWRQRRCIGQAIRLDGRQNLIQMVFIHGLEEEAFRQKVYMAAVCRCFPGKNPKGGDRVPNNEEITNCSEWLQSEFDLLRPELVIPVGKLAIAQYLDVKKLADVIGRSFTLSIYEQQVDLIPLPHPSGASTWHRMEPGMTLLQQALLLIEKHPAWKGLI